MRQGRPRRARGALLVAAFSLPVSHTAFAVDALYARAIGEPYDYRAPARAPAPGDAPAPQAPSGATAPSGTPPATDTPAPDVTLPGLGTETPAAVVDEGGGTSWSRILIGVLIVGAMAALASKGGGGEGDAQVNADLGGGGAAPPPPVGSGGGSGAPGGDTNPGGGSSPIVVGGGNGGSDGNNGRGRDDDDDRRDRDDKGGKKGRR